MVLLKLLILLVLSQSSLERNCQKGLSLWSSFAFIDHTFSEHVCVCVCDLNSPDGDWTWAHSSGSAESSPVDSQGFPYLCLLFL